MRSLLCLLPLICFSLAAPVDLSDHQKLILKIFGPDTDLIRAKLILEEEGAKFGLSGNEYFDGCTGSIMSIFYLFAESPTLHSPAIVKWIHKILCRFESGRLTAEEEADVKKDIAEAKKIIGTITFASKEDVGCFPEENFFPVSKSRLLIIYCRCSRCGRSAFPNPTQSSPSVSTL